MALLGAAEREGRINLAGLAEGGREVARGDLVLLAEGDRVPADGLLVPGVGAYAACMAGLRAVKGEKLVCRAWVVKPGRQIMFTEAEIHCVTGGDSQGPAFLLLNANGPTMFRRAVRPGDQLLINVKMTKSRGNKIGVAYVFDQALGIKTFADKAFYSIGGKDPKKPEIVPFLLKKDAQAHAAKTGGRLGTYEEALKAVSGRS